MSKAAEKAQAVDLQRMIDTALAFFLAGERCVPKFSFGRYPDHSLGAPVVVSYALAVEIALKILNRHYRLSAEGHDIAALFNALPHESRDHLFWVEEILPEISRAFVEWRYAYEQEFLSISPDAIRRSFIVLHAEIRRVDPNLTSTFEKNWGSFNPDWTWAWPELEIAQIENRRNA